MEKPENVLYPWIGTSLSAYLCKGQPSLAIGPAHNGDPSSRGLGAGM